MLLVEEQITINRPVSQVFSFVTDHTRIPLWKKGLVEVRRTTPGPVGVGTIDIHVSEFLGRRDEVAHELVAFDPPHRVAYRTVSGPFPGRGHFSFVSVPGGAAESGITQVTLHSEGEPGGVYRLLGPLLAAISRSQLRRDLRNLKTILEEQPG
jgi:uncharacterized membrane protein